MPRGRPQGYRLTEKHHKSYEMSKMLDLWIRGVAISDIAKVLGRNVQTIHERLRRYRYVFPELENIKDPQTRKSMLSEGLSLVLLNFAMSEEKLRKATLRELAQALGVVSHIRRSY